MPHLIDVALRTVRTDGPTRHVPTAIRKQENVGIEKKTVPSATEHGKEKGYRKPTFELTASSGIRFICWNRHLIFLNIWQILKKLATYTMPFHDT